MGALISFVCILYLLYLYVYIICMVICICICIYVKKLALNTWLVFGATSFRAGRPLISFVFVFVFSYHLDGYFSLYLYTCEYDLYLEHWSNQWGVLELCGLCQFGENSPCERRTPPLGEADSSGRG